MSGAQKIKENTMKILINLFLMDGIKHSDHMVSVEKIIDVEHTSYH